MSNWPNLTAAWTQKFVSSKASEGDMFFRGFALAAIFLCSTQTALGQGEWNLRSVTGAELPPGSWREYRITHRAIVPYEEIVRLIFLERDVRDGMRYQWVERVVDDDLGGLDPGKYWTITRTLESIDDPFAPAPEGFIQKTFDGKRERVPLGHPRTANSVSILPLGWEEVTTEAGTFRARVVDVVRFDLHEVQMPHFSVEEPVGLIFAENHLTKVELIAWGDGDMSRIVDTPPALPNGRRSLNELLTRVSQGTLTPVDLSRADFLRCVSEYVSHWMVLGHVDDYTEVFQQAEPFCRSIGLDSASASAEEMSELYQRLQSVWLRRAQFQSR